MPAVLVVDGYSIVIYMHDHQPPHVHVFARGCEAIFNLGCPQGPPDLRQSFRFKDRELHSIHRLIEQNIELLCTFWRSVHADQ